MANRVYNKGANFERTVKKSLEETGHFVIRSAGSKGPADLIAVNKMGDVTLIQCETSTTTKSKREKLKMIALMYDTNALMVKKGPKGHIWTTIRSKNDTA